MVENAVKYFIFGRAAEANARKSKGQRSQYIKGKIFGKFIEDDFVASEKVIFIYFRVIKSQTVSKSYPFLFCITRF